MHIDLTALPQRDGHACAGHVRLFQEVGRGAMGVVFSGWHETLRIPVAVKLLARTAAAGSEALARFQREARLSAELDEPNLIRVFDCGTAGPYPFLVMEWVAGASLASVVRQAGPLCEHEVVTVLRDVGEALMALHRHGVVHRDIKPGNLLLRHADGRVKVADLGIARELDTETQTLTRDRVVGTPAFLSPEQLTDSHTVGPASDLFSLGTTAYALLTAQLPFQGATVWETLVKVREEDLPDPATVGCAISPSLRQILYELTAKDVAHRLGRAEALLERLPVASLPFRPEVLEAANPEDTQPAEDPSAAALVRSPAPDIPPFGRTVTASAPRETIRLTQPLRGLLFCEGLQADVIAPLAPGAEPPNQLHIGAEKALALVGPEPATGPLVRAVSACADDPAVGVIFIRDWHDPEDPAQQDELDFFGPHCLMGTPGARLIDVLEAYSRDRRTATVIDTKGINDFEDSDMEGILKSLLGTRLRETVPVGVIGAWTHVKVHYLLYDLKTRGGFTRIATCAPLLAAPDTAAHEAAIHHFRTVLGITVCETILEFLSFLQVEGDASACERERQTGD